MTTLITSPLQKTLQSVSGSSPKDESALMSAVLQVIDQTRRDISALIETFERNIVCLDSQRDRVSDVIAFLEEAGGVTVRARNHATTEADAEKYKSQLKEFEVLFLSVLRKIDKCVEESSSGENGVNLLNGDVLMTVFDDKGLNILATHGIKLTSEALGFRSPDFSNLMSVQNSRIDVMNAMDMAVTLRNIILSDRTTIEIRRGFAVEALGMSNDIQGSLKETSFSKENRELQALEIAGELFDGSLAEPTQQQIFDSFARKTVPDEV